MPCGNIHCIKGSCVVCQSGPGKFTTKMRSMVESRNRADEVFTRLRGRLPSHYPVSQDQDNLTDFLHNYGMSFSGQDVHQRCDRTINDHANRVLMLHKNKITSDILRHKVVLFLIFFEGFRFAAKTNMRRVIRQIESFEKETEKTKEDIRGHTYDIFKMSYFLPLFDYFFKFLSDRLGGQHKGLLTVDEICSMREEIIGDSVTRNTCLKYDLGPRISPNQINFKTFLNDSLLEKLVKEDIYCYVSEDGNEHFVNIAAKSLFDWKKDFFNEKEHEVYWSRVSSNNKHVIKKFLDVYNDVPYGNQYSKKLALIRLIRRLAIYHPLDNGNGRTFYMMLLNIELIKLGECPTLQFHPTFFEFLTEEMLMGEVSEGQRRYHSFIQDGKADYVLSDDVAESVYQYSPIPKGYFDRCLEFSISRSEISKDLEGIDYDYDKTFHKVFC